jgi:septum site-determining protein MinD
MVSEDIAVGNHSPGDYEESLSISGRNGMAKVLTISSGKGGVGKTTTTANLAVALALNNQKVVCIDGDIGLRNLDVVLGLENRIVYDIVDIVEGRCRLRQAMIRDKRLPELFLIPAAQTRDKSAVSPSDMVRLCDELRPDFDWILIDSPAGIERGFRNALAPADVVVVVTNPEVSAVRDADRVIGLVEAEEKGPAKLIINRLNPILVKRGDMLNSEDVLELLAVDLIGIVPEDENVIVSSNRGQPVSMDGKTRAGQAFQNIAHRLMGETVPFLDLDARDGFFGRLARFMRSGGK